MSRAMTTSPRALFAAILSCAATLHAAEPPTTPAPGMGLIYVLRPSGSSPSTEVALYAGEALMGTFAGDEYLAFMAPPGRHTLQAKSPRGDGTVVVDVQEGIRSYVELRLTSDGIDMTLRERRDGERTREDLRFAPGKESAPLPLEMADVARASDGYERPHRGEASRDDETNLVIVYRRGRFGGAALNTSVYVDGSEVADMDNGTYIKLALPPGKHLFHGDDDEDEFALDLQPGGETYMRMRIVTGMWKGHGVLEVVDPYVGRSEFARDRKDDDLEYAKDLRDKTYIVKD